MIVVASFIDIPLGTVLVPGQATPMGWIYNGIQLEGVDHPVASRVIREATLQEWVDYNVSIGQPRFSVERTGQVFALELKFYWAQVD